MMNKRGADKLITVYWFMILVIIAGGVVLMANAFYSTPYDVRDVEAKILAEKVSNCVYPGGQFSPLLNSNGVFREEFKDNFMDRCDLNFQSTTEFEEIEYYVEIGMYTDIAREKPAFSLEAGNPNWVSDCSVDVQNDKLAKCYENSFWAKDPLGKIYYVKVLSAVRKVKQNA